MKKLLTASLLAVLSLSVYAQGLVSINESTYTITNGATGVKIGSTANSYYFALLTSSDATGSTTLPSINTSTLQTLANSLSTWTDAGVPGTNATGILGGKIAGTSAITGVAVNGWAPGATNFTIVVGWSATEGSTWAQVYQELKNNSWLDISPTGLFGYSSEGYLMATSLSPAGTVFGTQAGGISSGFVLNTIVPEPTTMALAALGGAAMLLIRRKK